MAHQPSDAESSAGQTVPFTVLHQWRTTLDIHLAAMRQADTELWRHHRQPGTWGSPCSTGLPSTRPPCSATPPSSA